MKRALEKMIEIYKPEGIDWMGFKLCKSNPYTFHHIQEKKNSGKCDINNGAILTKRAHILLNLLEKRVPLAYEEYQKLFRIINNSKSPIDEELLEDIYLLMLDTFFHQDFGEISDITIDFKGLREQELSDHNEKAHSHQKYINKPHKLQR